MRGTTGISSQGTLQKVRKHLLLLAGRRTGSRSRASAAVPGEHIARIWPDGARAGRGRAELGLSYKDAGVDIDAGEALVDAIRPLARATRRPGSVDDLGGFGALFDPRAAG